MRPKLTYANVMATLALFIALGGASYAAFKLPKNSVGTKQLKRNAVTTPKIRNEAITAAKLKKGTLTGSSPGTVPSPQSGSSLTAPEPWHEVGAAGEPLFLHDYHNATATSATAAFFKDHEGIVHLKGTVAGGTANDVFQLPVGFRATKSQHFTVPCNPCGTAGSGLLVITAPQGMVQSPSNSASLDGVTFRAEP